MNWEPHEGNQKRCRQHSQVFPKTSTCSQCEPGGAPLSAVAPITTDKELDLIESELRSEARYYRKLGRDLTGDGAQGTARDINSGLKAAEVSLKFDRAYKELVQARKDREHDRWLVEQNRLLKGDGAS